ncbi:MAG TPA: Hpt domain-containing protein [Bryobacteraceae bacterium]|nr:Hpt domain-containing protein [Bryobacteraceae bacterium]
MGTSEKNPVLDRGQLSEVTLEDEALMRELVAALIADTQQQLPLLDLAIRSTDLKQCASLAHYCKGACANVGAKAAATVLADLERSAKSGAAEECSRQLATLSFEVERLRAEHTIAIDRPRGFCPVLAIVNDTKL